MQGTVQLNINEVSLGKILIRFLDTWFVYLYITILLYAIREELGKSPRHLEEANTLIKEYKDIPF